MCAAMAAFVRAGTPPLHGDGDAIGAVGMLSAPLRVDAPDEVIYMLEGLRYSAAGTPLQSRGGPMKVCIEARRPGGRI